jgi:nitrite reductase/ring-hydroxylating ferredoxin subunit
MHMQKPTETSGQCDEAGCFLPADRRAFLKQSMASVVAALVATGCSRVRALEMPLGFTSADRIAGKSVAFAIPQSDGAQIDKENAVILVRWQKAMYAFDLSCPHQNTALRWDSSDPAFQCPKHHSRFKPTGEYMPGSGRATRNMDRFAIARDAGGVRVDLDKLYREDEDGPQWTAAVVKLA